MQLNLLNDRLGTGLTQALHWSVRRYRDRTHWKRQARDQAAVRRLQSVSRQAEAREDIVCSLCFLVSLVSSTMVCTLIG